MRQRSRRVGTSVNVPSQQHHLLQQHLDSAYEMTQYGNSETEIRTLNGLHLCIHAVLSVKYVCWGVVGDSGGA